MDSRVHRYSRELNDRLVEEVIDTPLGKLTFISERTDSSWNTITKKWWVTDSNELKIATWIEEHSDWIYKLDIYTIVDQEWGVYGAPTTFFQRVNIMYLYLNLMGYENGMFALYDNPIEVMNLFKALEENDERLIQEINLSPIDISYFC